MKLVRPAPNSEGETEMLSSPSSMLTSAGTAGRGSFSKSLLPQAVIASAASPAASATSALPLLLMRGGI